MKVLHVITSLKRSGGGPARSVQGLVAELNRAGVEAWLMSLRQGETPWVEGVSHFVNGEPFENVLYRIKPDIVHLHGLWSFALHRCAAICRRWHVPYVIAPRRAGDIAVNYADPEKAGRLLGWHAEKNLEDMCRDTYRFQKQNPKGYRA